MQKRCKRGHLLEHNRYQVKTTHKKSGLESGCRLCKNMRNKYQYIKTTLKQENLHDQIPTLEDFAATFNFH